MGAKKSYFWATLLSIIAIGMGVCNLLSYVLAEQACHNRIFSLETFLTLIITLLGISVTFIVGLQIFNVLEFRQEIKELREAKDKLEKMSASSMYYNSYTIGRINQSEEVYERAFRAYNNSLIHLMNFDEVDIKLDTILNKMDECVAGIPQPERKPSTQCKTILLEVERIRSILLRDERFLKTGQQDRYCEIVEKFIEEVKNIVEKEEAKKKAMSKSACGCFIA